MDNIILAFEEKYNVGKIENATSDELISMIGEMKLYKEKYEVLRSQREQIKNNPKDYESFTQQDDYALKKINQLVSYLDTMVKLAEIEGKKYTIERTVRVIKLLKTPLKDVLNSFDNPVPKITSTEIIPQKGSPLNKNKRKRRTRLGLETLTPKVVESYQELYDEGKYTWAQIFDKLSKQSKKLFGEKLTSGSLQGIYNRRKNHII
jgi:hypothetical protein